MAVADATASGRCRWRRYATAAFIMAWLAIQIVVPFVQKFELPSLRYRYARYSWAMYSQLGPRYEVSLFRTRGAGDHEPIPDIGRYVYRYRSPDPMPMIAAYQSADEVLDRFTRLVGAIARERRDGYTYVASIRWTSNRPGATASAELRADAAP
jgi:hypothetical protein